LVCRAFSEMVNIRDILGWPLSRVSLFFFMMKNLWVAYCAYVALSYEVVIAMLERRSQLVFRYLHVKRVLILNYCDTSTLSAPLFPSYLFYTPFSPARTHYLWLVRFLRHFINIFQTCSPTSEKFSETAAAYKMYKNKKQATLCFIYEPRTHKKFARDSTMRVAF